MKLRHFIYWPRSVLSGYGTEAQQATARDLPRLSTAADLLRVYQKVIPTRRSIGGIQAARVVRFGHFLRGCVRGDACAAQRGRRRDLVVSLSKSRRQEAPGGKGVSATRTSVADIVAHTRLGYGTGTPIAPSGAMFLGQKRRNGRGHEVKVLIDISHPAHVHFFRHPLRLLQARGHEVLVTSRKKEMALDLLRELQIEHIELSAMGKRGMLSLARELVIRDLKLRRIVRLNSKENCHSKRSSFRGSRQRDP